MEWNELDQLPAFYGVREAAVFLGVDFSNLRKQARFKNSMYACDCARKTAGELTPLWSLGRLEEIQKAKQARNS